MTEDRTMNDAREKACHKLNYIGEKHIAYEKGFTDGWKARRGQPYRWCPECQIEVDSKNVTYWERHEMCGGEVEIKTEPYTEAKGESR